MDHVHLTKNNLAKSKHRSLGLVKIITQHQADQIEANRLINQLMQLMARKKTLGCNIVQKIHEYNEKSEQRDSSQEIHLELATHSLRDRIWLMELLETIDTPQSIKKKEVRRLVKRKRSVQHINQKMLAVIKDIYELQCIIGHVKMTGMSANHDLKVHSTYIKKHVPQMLFKMKTD